MSTESQQEILIQRVQALTRKGWRVEFQTEQSATLVKGHRPNHILHLLLTVITGGLWGIFVWLPIALFGGEQRMTINAATLGNARDVMKQRPIARPGGPTDEMIEHDIQRLEKEHNRSHEPGSIG